jgi:hypothetical protein
VYAHLGSHCSSLHETIRMMRRFAAVTLGIAGSAMVFALACSLSRQGAGPTSFDSSTADSPEDQHLLDGGAEAMEAMSDAVGDGAQGVDGQEETGSTCPLACSDAGGICEGDAGQCSIYCGVQNPCPSVHCPSGLPCFVDCTGGQACSGGVDCSQSSDCTVVCGGGATCGAINCGGGTCTVLCESSGSCPAAIACKSTSACNVQCLASDTCWGTISSTAQATTVQCTQPNTCTQNISCTGATCQVYCIDGGSCSGGECCDAGTCNPQATPLCP